MSILSLFHYSKSWLKTPFHWHGFSKNGCDCIGLIVGILYENKIITDNFIKDFKKIKYGNNLTKINFQKMIDKILQYFIEVDDIQKADLLLTECRNSPIHFIIYEKWKNKKDAKIIHITQEIGMVFESNFNEKINIKKMFCLK